jgi:ketosteroid isomerase-like protein
MTTTPQVVQDNVALVKRGYDAFSAGDMPTLQALYHAEAAFYTVPQQKGDGVYRGRDAILAFFVTLFNESKGSFKAKPMTIAAADDRVFVLQDISGERNGFSLHEQNVMVFLIDGGAVREMREFIPPTSHIKDFWAA